jgi:arylformamidase
MAGIDLEAEYNVRARVPEHPQIFAEWARDAEDYRAAMFAAGRADLGLRYGDTPRQYLDLFVPESRGHDASLALFIHGGYWRGLDPSSFSHMARGPNGHGIAVAVIGYDLCPKVTIVEIIEQVRRACIFLWSRFGKRMLACGHSAGGHLAAAMVATDWPSLYPKAPADLVPAAFAISGVFDLTPLVALGMNEDLRLDTEEARRVSPLFWSVPPSRVLDTVVGNLETSEFKRQSRTIVDSWRGPAETRYAEMPGNHFTVLGPLADPAGAMAARVAQLAERVRS